MVRSDFVGKLTSQIINPVHCSIIKENMLVDFISGLLSTFLTFSIVSHLLRGKKF